MAKLTEQDVLELRGLYRDGGWSLVRLAERYQGSDNHWNRKSG